MSTLKIVVRIAAFAGLLLQSGVQVEASGCCDQDCTDAYGTMLNSGVRPGDAAEWYRECLKSCKEHGDPTTCPVADAMAVSNSTEANRVREAVLRDVAPRRAVEPVDGVTTVHGSKPARAFKRAKDTVEVEPGQYVPLACRRE